MSNNDDEKRTKSRLATWCNCDNGNESHTARFPEILQNFSERRFCGVCAR